MQTQTYVRDTVDYEADKHQDIIDSLYEDDDDSYYPEYDDPTSF